MSEYGPEAYAEEGAKPIFRPDSDSMGPIERANVVAYLGLMNQRLANVEAQLKSKPVLITDTTR